MHPSDIDYLLARNLSTSVLNGSHVELDLYHHHSVRRETYSDHQAVGAVITTAILD